MSRTMAIALAFGLLGSAALAATPGHQLVAPNFNPGLKTVPFVLSAQAAHAAGSCEQQLVTRIDAGTVVAGPDGLVVHVTGTATGAAGSDARLVITSTTPDGHSANADFMSCRSPVIVDSSKPVATSMSLSQNAALQSIIVRAQANALVLYTSNAH